MGYETDFTITVKDDVNKTLIGDETLNARIVAYLTKIAEDGKHENQYYFKELLDSVHIDPVTGFQTNILAKWYECNDDMRAMSAAVADVLFMVEGKGEEDGDCWRNYFLNGKMQECQAKVTVTYPAFDMKKMK